MTDFYKLIYRSLSVLIILMTLISKTYAAPPQSLSYQGYLNGADGLPVNAAVNITFRLYSVSTGGTSLWADTQSVSVNQGLFNVELGTSANPLPKTSFNTLLWLGIEIASDGEMTPRNALNSVGNAFHAEDADTVGGLPPVTQGIPVYGSTSYCFVANTGADGLSLSAACRTIPYRSGPCGFSSCSYYYNCAGQETASKISTLCADTGVLKGYLVSP